MSGFMDDNTPPALHLSDLHVTDDSGRANTELESFLTNSNNTFTINFTPPPPPPPHPVPFNVNVEPIPHTGDDNHDIDHTFNDGSVVYGNINDNIPFTATLHRCKQPYDNR